MIFHSIPMAQQPSERQSIVGSTQIINHEQLDCKIANDVAYGLWKYNDKQVDVKGTPDEPYFNGKHVYAILGYASARRALQEHV